MSKPPFFSSSSASCCGDLLDDLGGDHFTRAAPCREAVEDHECVLFFHCRVEILLAIIACASANVQNAADMTSCTSDTTGRESDLPLEVMYTLLFFAHFGCVGEKLLGEKWSIEVGGGGGVDGNCLQARRCEQCSSSFER